MAKQSEAGINSDAFQAFVDWLEGEIRRWESSGELCREFSERVIYRLLGMGDVEDLDGERRRPVGQG